MTFSTTPPRLILRSQTKYLQATCKMGRFETIENAFVPVDFFLVKKTPRGSKLMMRVLTFCVLAVTLCTFVFLAYDSSLVTVTITEIKTADLTGKQGWGKCTMISKVTDAYSDSTTAGAFNLVNVMESKSECTANLAVTNPCDAASSGGAGVAITDYDIKGMTTDAAGALYLVSKSGTTEGLFVLSKFDPSSGTIITITDSNTWGILATAWETTNSMPVYDISVTMQISSVGIMYISQHPGRVTNGDQTIYWFDPLTSTSSSYTDSAWGSISSSSTIGGTYLSSFALDSADGAWVMLTTYDGDIGWTGYDGGGGVGSSPIGASRPAWNITVSIYKFDSATFSTSMTLKFSTTMGTFGSYEDFRLSFDFNGDLWALWWTTTRTPDAAYTATLNKIGASSSTPDASVVLISGASSTPTLHGITTVYTSAVTIAYTIGTNVVRSDGAIEKYGSSGALVDTYTVAGTLSATKFAVDIFGDIWFAQPAGAASISKFSDGGTIAVSLKSYADGNSEWFVCGGTKQATVPGSVEELNTACALNGIKWAATNTEVGGGDTFFSNADFTTQASICDSTLYTRICDVVAVLPPYICTKEEPASVTAYLGVAAANSELLYVSLIFFCGFVFDAISRWNRAKEGGDSDGETRAEEEATGAGEKGEVEMAPAASLSRKASLLLMANNNAALEKKVATMEKEMSTAKKEAAAMKKEMAALKMQFATLLSNQGSQL